MKTNQRATGATLPRTHQGAIASRITPEQQLQRTVMCCLLWEDTFYEAGMTAAGRIALLVPQCTTPFLYTLVVDTREKSKLRHVPLLLVREMARSPHMAQRTAVAGLLERVIQRPDELTEFLSIYWKDGRQPLSAQVKKGLGRAFAKFSEHQLAKYDRDNAVKLRDVLFLSHAKPKDAQGITKLQRKADRGKAYSDFELNEQEGVYYRVAQRLLATPDTWEVKLSAVGAQEGKTDAEKAEDKHEVWLRMLGERKLGALAFLRNLRNMLEVGIDRSVLVDYAATMNVERVLPFRFLAAARHTPQLEQTLEGLMLRCLEGQEKLPGRTVLMVDVSGSMNKALSQKSELLRLDAAYGLGILLREVCEHIDIYTFSNYAKYVAARHGFGLRDAMAKSQAHSGTNLGAALAVVNKEVGYDRIIVLTDEQSTDAVGKPRDGARGYMVNVASYKNGVGYGAWHHIDGWSEHIIEYIRAVEAQEAAQ